MLHWRVQKDSIIFLKSTNPKHIKANMEIFDCVLTGGEMTQIKGFDRSIQFITMMLEEQKRNLGTWKPEDLFPSSTPTTRTQGRLDMTMTACTVVVTAFPWLMATVNE